MNKLPINKLKTTAVTVLWEVQDIWNLTFDGVESSCFFLTDHTLYLSARRYETSIAVYLCRGDKNFAASMHVLRLFCKLYVIDNYGQERLIGEKEVVTEKAKDLVLLESLMITDLQREKAEILHGNTLTISCSLSTSYKVNLMKKEERETERPILRTETLSSDLEEFYKAQTHCDVVLKAENVEFPVHRSILSARSSVFAKMFSPVESSEVMDLPGVKSSTLREVLNYIYSGKIRGLTPATAIEMYITADRYSLLDLKTICQITLQSTLTTENVFDVADLAHTYLDLLLKQEVEKFIIENVSTIIHSDRWKDFSHQKYMFANEILTSVLLKMQKKK